MVVSVTKNNLADAPKNRGTLYRREVKTMADIKFEGMATVIPAEADSNPDAYLCIGKDNPVVRVGNKNDPTLQEMADALNRWARKFDET